MYEIWYFLASIMGIIFFPLFQASEGKRGAREECQTHMMGKGTEKKK